jgi:RHS repeat-associated protein
MQGMRLVVAMVAALLVLGSGMAFAEQDESGSESSQADAALSPPEANPGSGVVADRTASSETIALPDGQLETRIYPDPINYRDEEGGWRPIGETLHETGEQTLVNGPNDFDVTLPKQIDAKPVRFEVGGEWVESQLLRKDLEGADLEGAVATYEGEGNAPSFEFTGLSNGLKEEIELAGPGQASTFSYQLSASSGLEPSLAEDGSIQFRDSEGKTVIVLPAPVMSDSAGAESRAVSYELGPEEEGHWKLSVTADREWLEQPDRVFPVAIDPTMTIGPALDCVIGGHKGETGWIDCAAWGRKDLLIGYAPKVKSAEDNWWRTLMEFETDAVPANSEISSAAFNIHSLEVAQNTKGVELRKTTKPWTWEASWSRYDGPTHLWSTEGGDYSESLGEVLTATRGNQIGWWQFNVPTSIVEKEVNAEEWMQTILKLIDDKVRECGTESCTQRKVDFDSSAATTTANRPYLSIVYKAPAPIVVTEAATSVGETGATLKSQVNPHGYATTYQFEYGTTTSYGTKAPVTAESVGSGKTNVALSKAISGLKGSTTYHYRVSATNTYGTSVGVDKSFTTPKLPSVTTEAASAITGTEATLKAIINPNGSVTTYQFEYGPTTSYGMKVPISPGSAGLGTIALPFSNAVSGLKEGTTYHYRVVASNEGGTAVGADKSLTTLDPPETTITSPMPSYTKGEKQAITFTSDQSGSTFKCGFDEGEKPTKTCTSPESTPEHPTSGWHTFVVAAVNAKGETDPTPAKYVFNAAIYPPAPTTSKLTAPTEGETTAGYFTLQAEWGNPPAGGGVSSVTFQTKLDSWDEFRTLPSECVIGNEGKTVTWPLSVSQNPGHTDPVFLKVYGCSIFQAAGYPGDLKFRAVFDGGISAAGASEPVTTEYLGKHDGVGAPTDAVEGVGPASLDLLTGNYTLSRTDVSIPVPGSEANLEFTRTYQSNYNDEAVPSFALGGMWQPSAPVEQEFQGEAWSELRERHENEVPAQYDKECEEEGYSHAECMVEEAIPAADWIELLDNEGGAAAFEIQGGNFIAPEYLKGYVLSKHVEGATTTFELASPEGTHTVFVKNEVGIQGSYRPATVSWQATAKSARMLYEQVPGTGHYRLTEMIAPAPVTCSDTGAISTAGCRVLTFQYLECTCDGKTRLSSITYYNSSGQVAQKQEVAKYKYDSKYRLIAEWDPRISPCLKETPCLQETYSYDEFYKMLSLTPPGQKPWEFGYYDWHNSHLEGRLKSVKRASLVESQPIAQTSIVYEVPISGSGVPDMSAPTVAKWGQTDYPVNATAIFPPTQVPASEPPSDYSQASVTYMDPDGYAVNRASPQLPGATGPSIQTSETDRHGNVVRSLSPQNRLRALAEGSNSVSRSNFLATIRQYNSDGTELAGEFGPMHQVKLESGETVQARLLRAINYDENWPGTGVKPHLPTKEMTTTLVGLSELDKRFTETKYDWTLLKPTETITDPGKEHLELKTRIAYDPVTGLPTERSLPAKPEGGDAHTTKTIYYTAPAGQKGPCEDNAAYAGLPCKTLPASQPGTAGLPELLVTRYAKYNGLGEPEEVIESPGGKEEAGKTRKTIKTYDTAGRETTSRQIGGGTALPPTQTVYDDEFTGLPKEQKFICESECGAGFSYSSSFGEAGGAAGQFNHPSDVAIDGKGNLWVVDTANNRIEQFTEGGGSPKAFGSLGSTGGKLSSPSGIAIDPSGNIWVTDTGNTRVEEFSESGAFLATFGSNVNKTKVESGGTKAEKNLCTAASGNVCQAGTPGSIEGQMREPVGIAASSGGSLFVVEKGNNRVEKFSSTGALLASFGTSGSGEAQLKGATAIAVAPDGSLWVADTGNNRIEEWSSTYSFVRVVGKGGAGNGEFNRPDAIEADSAGNVLVADQGNGRVQRFSPSGVFIARFGASEPGPGQFSFSDPVGIAVNAKGDVWVTDPGHNQIQKWVPQAAFDSQATTTSYDELGRPAEYVDADGNPSTVSYDLLGRVLTTTDGKGSQTVTYDSTSGVPVALQDSAAGTFTASYDADGRMVKQGLPNGLAAETTYDEAGQPIHLTYTKTDCTVKCTWLDFGAERSIYGQVLSQTSLASSQQYSYDRAGRLTLVKDTPQGGSCTTRQYSYDADSNRTKLTTRAPGIGGACDTSSEGTPQSYSYDAADRLTDSGIVYDNFGRITSLPAKDAGGSALVTSFYSNEMLASQSQGGITNSYQLDSTGRVRQVTQTGTKEGTEVFHYAMASGSTAWTERGGTWTRSIAGISGGLAAIQESSGTTSLQLTNLHGDVVATASLSLSAKEPTANFEFDEFGNPKKGSAGRYGWLGGPKRRTELPSGVIQMGVRSYVPAIGRFISVDTVQGGSANAYDYSNADPVNQLDLSGTEPYGNDCAAGFAGCQCKLHVKLWSHKRGRMGIRVTRGCNRGGGITLTGYAIGFYQTHSGIGGIIHHFDKMDNPHFLNPPKVEAVCGPTDRCQSHQDHKGTFVCTPGEEYEVRITWGFSYNYRGEGHEEQLQVAAQEYCAE